MKGLLKYLKPYTKESILGPLGKLCEATLELIVPLVVASIIDRGIGGGNLRHLWLMVGVLALLGLVGLAFSVLAQYFSAKTAVGFVTSVRHAMYTHIQTLSYADIDRLGTSTVIARMTTDSSRVQTGVNDISHHLIILLDVGEHATLFVGAVHEVEQVKRLVVGVLPESIILGIKQSALGAGCDLDVDGLTVAGFQHSQTAGGNGQIHGVQFPHCGIGVGVHILQIGTIAGLVALRAGKKIGTGKQTHDIDIAVVVLTEELADIQCHLNESTGAGTTGHGRNDHD